LKILASFKSLPTEPVALRLLVCAAFFIAGLPDPARWHRRSDNSSPAGRMGKEPQGEPMNIQRIIEIKGVMSPLDS
jgi:hypothetical protein